MSNAIVVLNAGSSSIKFSLFLDRGASLEADARGQIEGLYTAARFVAKNKDGAVKHEKSWPAGAQLAVNYFVYRVSRELGSLAASLGVLDAIVFTAGIGENASEIRRRVCREAAWLGVEIDEAANAGG